MDLFFFLEEIKKEPLKNGPYLEIALDVWHLILDVLVNTFLQNFITILVNGAFNDASTAIITVSTNHKAINEFISIAIFPNGKAISQALLVIVNIFSSSFAPIFQEAFFHKCSTIIFSDIRIKIITLNFPKRAKQSKKMVC